MNTTAAELTALRANLYAQYEAADRWLEQAAKDPRCRADQLQIQHVKKMAAAYAAFVNARVALETQRR